MRWIANENLLPRGVCHVRTYEGLIASHVLGNLSGLFVEKTGRLIVSRVRVTNVIAKQVERIGHRELLLLLLFDNVESLEHRRVYDSSLR